MKSFTIYLSFLLLTGNILAQQMNVIDLSTPAKNGGKPVLQCMNERHSSRDFIDKDISMEQLSSLLWAAYGVNRPEDGKRTAPSAHNKQEVDVFVFTKAGAFKYDAFKNQLIQIRDTDVRIDAGKQDFVGVAALNLVYVVDMKKSSSENENEIITSAAICTGAIVQNVYLYCASEGLDCVVRGWVDAEKISKTLNLTESQRVIVAQSVGYTE